MNKKMLLILIAVILLIAITLAIVFVVLSLNTTKPKEETLKINKSHVMFTFADSFVTNIKESKRILKSVIEVEVADRKTENLLIAREAEIRNEIYLTLRSKKEEDFEGAEGQTNLQKEIMDIIKRILKTDKVLNVYFLEFIIS